MTATERQAVEAEIKKIEETAARVAALTHPQRVRAQAQRLLSSIGIVAVASFLIIATYPRPTKCGVTRYYIYRVMSALENCAVRHDQKVRELNERIARKEPVYEREVPLSCGDVVYAKETNALDEITSTAPCREEYGR